MGEIIGKQVSYRDLLHLELQEYIQTLATHQHVKGHLHMGWEVIHDSFRGSRPIFLLLFFFT